MRASVEVIFEISLRRSAFSTHGTASIYALRINYHKQYSILGLILEILIPKF